MQFRGWIGRTAALVLCATAFYGRPAQAQESVCARVKIEIKQELTLERQAFDAEMRITNSLPATPLTEIQVEVVVTDEMGVPVPVTTDPNDLSAKFYVRQTQRSGIENTTGSGQVAGGSTATINWLLIPAPGAAGGTPFGKRYLVGATLRYRFGTETHVMELNPDAIMVKPLPSLTLDYFLTRDVIADDPFTQQIEAPEPCTLGVRVKNDGLATAKQLKINSAQPRIIDNQQGLPITFQIVGSYVQDLPATNSLLIDFGDIPSSSSKMGRWQMESNLAGTFVDFTATFTHSDELGGALTSLLQATNAHLLVRDVRVDLPGRDIVRDFLAADGTAYNLYESEGQDSSVADRSNEATLAAAGDGYRLTMPPVAGFFYVRKPDPHGGQKALGPVQRADAKTIAAENVWLSKTKNPDTQQWQYWFNLFDVNTPGAYDMAFRDRDTSPSAPVLQFIPDRTIKENQQLGFLVEASSPNGKPVSLAADPLPSGATFNDQGDGTGVFDWTPATGQAGDYVINYRASDGALTGTRAAKIRVESLEPPGGPAIPEIVAPLRNAEIPSQRPQFKVLASEASNDPTQTVQFELYADEGFSTVLARETVARNAVAGQPTVWVPPLDLNDNTRYWWRARAQAGNGVNSEWVDGTFFVNLYNDAPESFNLTSPSAGSDVDSLTPSLSATAAVDRDGDAVTYGFDIYSDAALTLRQGGVSGLSADGNALVRWTVATPLNDHATYYWRGVATDEHGAQTLTPARSFNVSTDNHAPTVPTIVSPQPGADVTTAGVALLRVGNGVDADDDATSYVFEIDAVNTFDSSDRQTSDPIAADASGVTGWEAASLVENVHYYWRAKATDGRAESEWIAGDFVMNAFNEAPSTPIPSNPGDHAWVSTLTPLFEVHPSKDPEGDPVLYQFEVGRDDSGTLVASGTSTSPSWRPSAALSDYTTYFWRVRSQDAAGATNYMSVLSYFSIHTGVYAAPTLQMSAPSKIFDSRNGNPSIQWLAAQPSGASTLALYYDQAGSGYAGTKIVDGLRQAVGQGPGTYVWNIAGLMPGAYHVYGVNYDSKGLARAYASGAVVVPNRPQRGAVQANAVTGLDLREGLDTGKIDVVLQRAPVKDVVISVSSNDASEAYAQPESLSFTPQNWSVPQRVTLTALKDATVDGDQTAKITLGRPESLDPDYNGLDARSFIVNVRDQDTSSTYGLTVSDVILIGKQQVGDHWEYRYRFALTNTGPVAQGFSIYAGAAQGFTIVNNGNETFGSIGTGETLISTSEVVLSRPDEVDGLHPEIIWLSGEL